MITHLFHPLMIRAKNARSQTVVWMIIGQEGESQEGVITYPLLLKDVRAAHEESSAWALDGKGSRYPSGGPCCRSSC